jgi:hypothetical protein
MKRKIIFAATAFVALLLATQFACNDNKGGTTPAPNNDAPPTTVNNGAQEPFPDFGFMLPPKTADSLGIRVFRLSQNYPDKLPEQPLPPFFKTDFQKDWKKYLLEVQKYCFEGNTEVDFRVEDNKVRSWYHMPWQHYTSNGREGFHGLTKEAPVQPYQLAATQSFATGGAWAVGFFNDVAGYSIGQVWKDHNRPDAKAMGSGFKNGAVLFKILFTSIPPDVVEKQVPFLRNGQWWDAYATYNFAKDEHMPIKVALIQMDIMVRDDRAPNGWVFGNFQYNGKMNRPNKWENLVPVGIMWGQDPQDSTNQSNPQPKVTIINPKLTETIINPDTTELPPTHLGWNGRLNGPVDNPKSSCYSCHSTAEYPQGSPMSPLFDADTLAANPIGSPGWMRWFSNLKCGTPFDGPGFQSTDFCLQMAESIQNFTSWKQNGQNGYYYTEYNQPKLKAGEKAAPQRKVFSLGRRNQ